jgi:hypothetical protein
MQKVCDVLERFLAEGVIQKYAIGGATAAGFHGEPLATRDIDVFCYLDLPEGAFLVTLEPIFKKLAEMGFTTFDEEGILIHGFPVQFLPVSTPLETEAVENARVLNWENHTIRVMSPEYLAAIAIAVGRPKDRARLVYLYSLQLFNKSIFTDILLRHGLSETWSAWAKGLGLLKSFFET